MKKIFFAISVLLVSISGWSQVPQGFKYQAVARNESDELIAASNINIRISIIDSAAGGAVVYTEVHKTGTNKFGLFSVKIGEGITPTGIFSNIPWQTANKWMQVEIDPDAGSSFTFMGISELVSVPYALLAGKAVNESQTLSISGSTISISGGNSITLPPGSVDTDDQTLGLTGTTLSIADGNSVDLSVIQDGVNDADSDPTNELQTLSLAGTVVSISGGNSITLPSGTVDTDDQNLSFAGTTLSIDDGNSVNLSSLLNDADSDPINELQTLSLSGSSLSISGGNSITLPSGGGNDADADSTNELNTSFALDTLNQQLSITDPGGTITIDISPLFATSVPDSDWTISGNNMYNNNSGNVGVGTTTPSAKLHIAGNDGVLATGIFGSGIIPATGAGTRMMWYPAKAAFRTGTVTGTNWDATNVGDYSFASGDNTKASGTKSTAMGSMTNATGNLSTALGLSTAASGNVATAMGASSNAQGDRATATGFATNAVGHNSFSMGNLTIANDQNSFAGGYQSTARGTESFALGRQSSTNGRASFAMGDSVIATGDNTTALGYHASTNSNAGSFVYGDQSTTTIMNASGTNQFMVRSTGGATFYSTSSGAQGTWVGVNLAPGGNSWDIVSDAHRKENFKPLDGEKILKKIADFRLGTWNYIGQDPAHFRHYGPMAQDFYAAFGNDGIGTIGRNTAISTADLIGVNFTAIHALEKRTSEQAQAQEDLQKLVGQLQEENIQLKERLEKVETRVKKLNKKIRKSKTIINPRF